MVWPRKDIELRIELPAIVDAEILANLFQMMRVADARVEQAQGEQYSTNERYRYAREVLKELTAVPEDATVPVILEAFRSARTRAVALIALYEARQTMGL